MAGVGTCIVNKGVEVVVHGQGWKTVRKKEGLTKGKE